ncbi:MAG: type II secretion system secretin GspD [Steroidobacteraceae bacterium]
MATSKGRGWNSGRRSRVAICVIHACLAAFLCVACVSVPQPSKVSRDHGKGEEAGAVEVGPGGSSEARKPVVIQGSGRLYASPADSYTSPTGEPGHVAGLTGSGNPSTPGGGTAPHGAAAVTAPANGEGFQLNFTDTDISAVVGAVLGDALNLPYVVDAQIKGTITLQAQRALSADEVLAALEGALRIQGVAMVNIDNVYHIVPVKEAMRRVPGLQVPGKLSPGFGVYIVPLQYVSAVEMQSTLQPFMSEGAVLRVDEGRNLLLLGGSHQEISSLLNIIATFDVDWMAGMSFGLYPLEYVDAKTLAGELAEVFSDTKSPINGVVRFVPLARLNSLMVVTAQPKYLRDVEAWIKRLDQHVSTPGRRIYVYDVQNGKADEIADSLNQILSTGSSTGNTRTQSANNHLTQGFGTSNSSSTPEAQGSAGTPTSSPFGSFQSAMAANGTMGSGATSTVASGNNTPSAAPKNAIEGESLRIVPSAENNSLLILASPSEFAVVDAALKKLDVLPIEVLIEASIAEVTLTDDLRYGLQWSYKAKEGTATYSESNGNVSPQFPGLSFLYTAKSISAVLNAMESLTKVRVLSAPKLVVLNNHEADLQVGDQVPIVTQAAVSTVGQNSPIVNSVDLKDTGVILKVIPRANTSGRVLLEVTQEVSDVVPTTTSSINSPTIQQRKFTSVVAVRDGETIALGGLIRDSQSRGGSGIPILRRIPVLGNLFGSDAHNSTRTELVVLITPHVIRTADESEDVMDELRRQFQGLRRLVPQWQSPGADGTRKPSRQGRAGAAQSEEEGQPSHETPAKP